MNLSNNELESLPSDMDSLIQLNCLDVSDNALTDLPEGLGRCSHLEQLFVRHNKLSSIPQFVRENRLKELCASFNVIKEFTNEHCEALVMLKVSFGKLSHKPKKCNKRLGTWRPPQR